MRLEWCHQQGLMNAASTDNGEEPPLGGWETLEMVKRYAHMDAGHLAEFAVTFWSHQTPEKQIATGQGGDKLLKNQENFGGASLIRTGDLRIMIPSL